MYALFCRHETVNDLYVLCCILCTRTEINELLTTFCYVFNNKTT